MQEAPPDRDLGLTFAGGGNRAFYCVGLMNEWATDLLPRTAGVAACSAGACTITGILANRIEETIEFWRWRRFGVLKNVTWSKLLRGERPAPHAAVYRDTLMFAFDKGGLERIREQPFPVLILCAKFPKLLPTALGTMVGLLGYTIEKKLKPKMLHPTIGYKLGFQPMLYDARDCETPHQLADLVIASSATPPFTPLGLYRQTKLLDGGMIDNAPAFAADAIPGVKRNIVFLTRPYPPTVLGKKGPRLYLAPTEELPANRWDYRDPRRVDATIEMGEREAATHKPLLDDFLKKRRYAASQSV